MAQQRQGISKQNVAASTVLFASLVWLYAGVAWLQPGPHLWGANLILASPVVVVGLLLYKPGPVAGERRMLIAICCVFVVILLAILCAATLLLLPITLLMAPVMVALGVACALRYQKPDPLRESGIDDATAARLEQALSLSEAELSQLLSVPRGGLRTWLGFTDRGRPAARLAAVCEIVTALDEQVGHDHVAEVVRRPMPTFGGRSLLEAMTEDPGAVSDEMAVSLDVGVTA